MRKWTLKTNKKQEEGGEQMNNKQRKTVDNKTAVLVIAIVLFLIVIVACAVLPEQRDVVSQIDGAETSKYTTPEETIASQGHTSISIYGEYITIYDEKYYLHRSDDTYLYLNVKNNGYDSRIQSVEIWLNSQRCGIYNIQEFINEGQIELSTYDKNTEINISVSYLDSEGSPITSEDYASFWIRFANIDFYGIQKNGGDF